MKRNLLGEIPPEDNEFVLINSENKFIGSFFSSVFNFVTFGAFAQKEHPHQEEHKHTLQNETKP